MKRIAAALLIATGAQAATFDFAELAGREKAERGHETGFAAAMLDGWTVDGVTVRATAGPGAHGFLDPLPAGALRLIGGLAGLVTLRRGRSDRGPRPA